MVTFFAFGFLFIFMPFQVFEVFQASNSQIIDAEVIYSEFGYENDSGEESCYMEIKLKLLPNDENILIQAQKPGHFSTCSSKKSFQAIYQSGDFTIVYLSKSGKYYLSKGSYIDAITPALFSVFWFLLLYLYIKKYSNSIPTQQP
ncbi:MAG: hypothetical protein GY823_14305 [Flavobacteriaceae bacterium]|nr:hypothetical protein [Flavobacteriaceae bacterium]